VDLDEGINWFRGDCHVHSAYSPGCELTPEQLAVAARAAGLDFVVATEHNSGEGHGAWAQVDAGELLVLYGRELVTRAGHWLALGLEPGQLVAWDYGVRDATITQHLDEVRRSGGLCVAAHPHAPYPSGTFMYRYEDFDAIEVWNGQWASDLPWQANNEAALSEWGRSLAADIHQNRWRPAMGNSDTHLTGQIATPHTVVAAADLTKDAILTSIRAGKTWIAESATVNLAFTLSAAGRRANIGAQLDTNGAPALAEVRVSGVPNGIVTFHTERGIAHRVELPAAGSGEAEWQTTAAESGFVRIEVRHPGGRMAALSNPIGLV
jgi:predicted metal-dependent phosphoesterase TrpH